MIEWRDIPGWPEYQVNSTGELRRAKTVRWFAAGAPKTGCPSNGYLSAHLYRDGKCYPIGVHVLVCLAFHGPKPSASHIKMNSDGGTHD